MAPGNRRTDDDRSDGGLPPTRQRDHQSDGTSPEAGQSDSGPPDSGPPGAGPPDSGPPGAGPPDSGPPDSGPPGDPERGGERIDTGATTAGLLPDGPGVAVLALVAVGIVALGVALGYSAVTLALLCGTGAVGALGVRVATSEDRPGTGVALLWVAAVAFAGLAVGLMGQSSGGVGTLLAALGVASGALLAPFAVLGSTVRLYGHGAGRRVVRRYVLGTLLLGGVAVVLLVATRLWSVGPDLLPPALTYAVVSGSLARRLFVAIVVYGLALFVGARAARALPVAVVVEPAAFDRVGRTREAIDRVYGYGIRALGLYIVLAQVGLLLVLGSGSDTDVGLLRGILRATAPLPVVAALGTAATALAALLVVLWLLRTVGGLTRAAVASVVLPPVVVVALAVLVSTVMPAQTGAFVDGFVETPVFESFLTDVSPAAFVGLLAVLFLASAAVFAVPTLVAGQGLGDESLAGIASAAVAVVVVVVVAVLAGRGLVVVAGVALAALVWEFGEFVTVASGELAAPGANLPDGFSRLASVHAVATLAVTGGAVVLAVLVFLVATGSALSTTAGTVVLVVTGLGIAALVLLLNG